MAEDDTAADDEDAGGASSINALQANIAARGSNAYYYAHGAKKHGPAWDGDPTPKLLTRETSEVQAPVRRTITTYSWLDEDSKIRVYIPFEDPVGDGDVTIEWTEKSIALAVKGPSVDWTFAVPALYDKIAGATFRVKPTKIVVTIKKLPESTFKWHDLKK